MITSLKLEKIKAQCHRRYFALPGTKAVQVWVEPLTAKLDRTVILPLLSVWTLIIL